MKKTSKSINNKIFKFTLIVFTPILLVFLGIYFVMSHQQTTNKKNDIDAAIELFAYENETEIQNIINRIGDLSSNQIIQNVLTFKSYDDKIIPDINTTWTIFSNMTNTIPLLESVAIYNKKTNTVISSSGKYDANIYFTKTYNYTDFDYNYWKSYREPLSTITILPPSQCATTTEKKSFIPIVFSSVGSIQSTSIIIANIDIEQLINSSINFNISPNSIVFLKNQNHGTLHAKKEYMQANNLLSLLQEISNKHTELNNANFSISHRGNKYYVSSTTPRKSILGYYYIAATPYSEIHHALYDNILWVILLLISVLIVYTTVLILVYKNLFPAYNHLLEVQGNNEESKKRGLLAHIGENITKLSEQNLELKKHMDNLLPIYQQRIITRILNNTDYSTDTENEFNKIEFKFDSFLSIAVKIYISNKTINSSDTDITKADIMTILELSLKERYETIPLPSSEDTWYAILNLDSASVTIEDITQDISNLIENLKLDVVVFDIIYGIGNIYSGLEGLLQTHSDAINDLLKNKEERKVIIPSTKLISNRNTLIIDESKLTNHLIAGHYDRAKVLIKEFTSQITKDNPQPYVSILNTILNIIYVNNIELDSSQSSAELISYLLTRPEEEIDEYIYKLIDILEENIQPSISKVDIDAVISYIYTHYNDDIYLDALAEKFNTNAKYLSKRIKQHINIGFKDYLLKLRIDQAKKLLSETDMSINDIAISVGIPRRNTFIGVFKKMVGTTPSEYRRTLK